MRVEDGWDIWKNFSRSAGAKLLSTVGGKIYKVIVIWSSIDFRKSLYRAQSWLFEQDGGWRRMRYLGNSRRSGGAKLFSKYGAKIHKGFIIGSCVEREVSVYWGRTFNVPSQCIYWDFRMKRKINGLNNTEYKVWLEILNWRKLHRVLNTCLFGFIRWSLCTTTR